MWIPQPHMWHWKVSEYVISAIYQLRLSTSGQQTSGVGSSIWYQNHPFDSRMISEIIGVENQTCLNMWILSYPGWHSPWDFRNSGGMVQFASVKIPGLDFRLGACLLMFDEFVRMLRTNIHNHHACFFCFCWLARLLMNECLFGRRPQPSWAQLATVVLSLSSKVQQQCRGPREAAVAKSTSRPQLRTIGSNLFSDIWLDDGEWLLSIYFEYFLNYELVLSLKANSMAVNDVMIHMIPWYIQRSAEMDTPAGHVLKRVLKCLGLDSKPGV